MKASKKGTKIFSESWAIRKARSGCLSFPGAVSFSPLNGFWCPDKATLQREEDCDAFRRNFWKAVSQEITQDFNGFRLI